MYRRGKGEGEGETKKPNSFRSGRTSFSCSFLFFYTLIIILNLTYLVKGSVANNPFLHTSYYWLAVLNQA